MLPYNQTCTCQPDVPVTDYYCKLFFTQHQCYLFSYSWYFMNALVNSLWNRTRTAFEMLGTGREVNVPGGDSAQKQPEQTEQDTSIAGSKGNDRMTGPRVACSTSDTVMPIRICPHCGYEIQTWILGELSCTRCENDIHPGEGMGSVLYYRASEISREAGYRV